MPVTDIEIIAGTYEEFLLGYKVVGKGDSKHRLVQSFADHSHRASIRSLCSKRKYLASGGADESIILYDLKTRKQAGVLVQHEGTVSCLSFSPNGSHLISSSEDGSIAVFRTGSWQLEKLLSKAHKGEAVTNLSIHPSGKLALSVGTDATLRTWNLVKGRQAYATNLGKNRTGNGRSVSCVLWSPDGEMYVLAIGVEVNIYTVSKAAVNYTFQLKKKVTDICYIEDSVLAIGDEGGGLTFHSISEKKQLNVVEAHANRVKCLSCVSVDGEKYLVSASSNGQIKLWKYQNANVNEICSTNCDCRITCLAVILEEQMFKKEKEEAVEINSTQCSTEDYEETVIVKQSRQDVSPKIHKSSKRAHKPETQSLKTSKFSKKSSSLEVICTRGQKWEVEEL